MKRWCILWRHPAADKWHFLDLVDATTPEEAWQVAHKEDELDPEDVYGVFLMPAPENMRVFYGIPHMV